MDTFSQTKNARYKRKCRADIAKKTGRNVGVNGRPPCVDKKGTEIILDLIFCDAKNGVYHTIDWVKDVVLYSFFYYCFYLDEKM
jgi:hypothetical protein